MLLDTGTGSMKSCVQELTDKPFIVLLSHGHVDHAMGAPEFDEAAKTGSENKDRKEIQTPPGCITHMLPGGLLSVVKDCPYQIIRLILKASRRPFPAASPHYA